MRAISFDEAKKIARKAGTILEKEYHATNDLAKSLAASALKCFGDRGIPSAEIIEIAIMIKTAGTKVYFKNEVILAEAVLNCYYIN